MPTVTRTCGHCGDPFGALDRGPRTRVYCCDHCNHQGLAASRRTRAAEHKAALAKMRAAESPPEPAPQSTAQSRAARLVPDSAGGGISPLGDEEWEFAQACAAYQKRIKRRFLSASEYLAVARELGYRKVA
jgi:hypothetical protein